MPSIRKITGRENSLKFANSGRLTAKPALASRIFYKEFSSAAALNVGQYPIASSNTGVYEKRNILIHSISITNKGESAKNLHFWRNNDDGGVDYDHPNHLFTIFCPPEVENSRLSLSLGPPASGGNNVYVEFALPLLVPGGCLVAVEGAGNAAAVEICYTVLNSTSMKGNLIYRYLAAASVNTFAGHNVPKTYSANLATTETNSFSASNATMTSNPSINIDSQPIDITAGRTDVQVATQVAAVSYPNYTAKLTSNNKVTFTQKVASDATPALTMTDATYINSTSGTHTITSSNFRGGSAEKTTVDDIEIWGGVLMNNTNLYGSESLAKSIVKNADNKTVATMVIRKGAVDAWPIPWFDTTGATPWYNVVQWSFAWNYIGGDSNVGDDTKVTMYKYPVYCKGAALGSNFHISNPSAHTAVDATRATWFYRPVKARGLDHGWV